MASGGGNNGTRGVFRGISCPVNGALTGTNNGSWVFVGGAGTFANLSDGSNASYLDKVTTGAGNYIQYPCADPVIATNNVIAAVRAYMKDSRPTASSSVKLFVGAPAGPTTQLAVTPLTGQSITSFASPPVQGPVNDATAWLYTNPNAGNVAWTATAIAALTAGVYDVVTNLTNETQFMELGLDVLVASVPYAPTISTPAGTIPDAGSLPVVWTHNDTLAASVTTKALTSNVVTLTTAAAHGFLVNQLVTVSIGDVVFDGTYQITGVTATTFTYAQTNANVGSTGATGTATVGDGAAQSSADIRVFSAAQYGAVGFSPDTSTPSWSTTVTGAGATVTPVGLVNGTTYRAYVRTSKTAGIQTLTSVWAFSGFTLAFVLPPTPTITATLDNANQRVQLAIAAFGNILSAEDASFEGLTTGSWVSSANATLTNTGAQAAVGARSLSCAMVAAAVMTVTTATGLAGDPCIAGAPYTVVGSFRTAVTARAITLGVSWYDNTGAFLSTTSSAVGSDASGAWTAYSVNVTAPANAAFAAVFVSWAAGAISEVHYVDKVGIAPGTGSAWSPGGATFALNITRTQAGATSTVRQLTALPANQAVTVFDYEADRGVSCTYTVTETATYSSGPVVTAAGTSAAVTPSNDGSWWVKAPLVPAVNLGGVGVIRVVKGSLEFERLEQQGVFRPIGRSTAVVVAGDMEGEDGALSWEVFGATEWALMDSLLRVQSSLLLQDPNGDQKYVRITSRSWKRTAGATQRRTVSVTYVETDAP